MKALSALILAIIAGALPAAAQMPFPLWRTVGGTNYDLQPLYAWRSDMVVKAATGQPTEALESQRPYPRWIGANYWEHFTVKEVRKPDLLRLEWQWGRNATNTTEIVLEHYPEFGKVTEGQWLKCFSCQVGHYPWTSYDGAARTLPLFDFGTPCPVAQSVAESGGKHRGG